MVAVSERFRLSPIVLYSTDKNDMNGTGMTCPIPFIITALVCSTAAAAPGAGDLRFAV